MAPRQEKSSLKRARQSVGDQDDDFKKVRRSQRINSQSKQHPKNYLPNQQLPSPVTHKESTPSEVKERTVSPPENHLLHVRQHTPPSSSSMSAFQSPPSDTQPFSQFVYPPQGLSYQVKDEEAEEVWGYLVALDHNFGDTLVLQNRAACPVEKSDTGKPYNRLPTDKEEYKKQEEHYEHEKSIHGVPAGGYLIGRHPECDRVLKPPTISNRHCVIFKENKDGTTVAVVEDLSANGTFVNEAIIGRNKRRELNDGDEISILGEARACFRYPRNHHTNAFSQLYTIQDQLGRGHFATVYLCVEKSSGTRFAVKKFEKRSGSQERSRTEGLQQEIAVLMSVSHPNVLCLKESFDESDAVYLVLELAPEGELFNWIVMKHKLTEDETRKLFTQLFQGIKYLHERNIVHRDIKPENILLVDKDLTVKIADFGLAKIIGEESFTTTLCGTPSYVAPEILAKSNHRRYTHAVDVWSLGVVLYICLCGFPPFSDELNTRDNPYSLSEQIMKGRFDYPSPYWDSVGDPALDLIDRMLEVNAEKRITIDECLEHPWTTGRDLPLTDSTDGLTGALGQLDFAKRKVYRERTLLSSINDVRIGKVIPTPDGMAPVLKFEKNTAQPRANGEVAQEPTPSADRNPEEFAQMGGKGDEPLFGYDGESHYPDQSFEQNKLASRATVL